MGMSTPTAMTAEEVTAKSSPTVKDVIINPITRYQLNEGKGIMYFSMDGVEAEIEISGVLIEDPELRKEFFSNIIRFRDMHPNIIRFENADPVQKIILTERFDYSLHQLVQGTSSKTKIWEYVDATEKHRFTPFFQGVIRGLLSVIEFLNSNNCCITISKHSLVFTSKTQTPKVLDLTDFGKKANLKSMLRDVASLIDLVVKSYQLKQNDVYYEVFDLISKLRSNENLIKLNKNPALNAQGDNLNFLCSVRDKLVASGTMYSRSNIYNKGDRAYANWQSESQKYLLLNEAFNFQREQQLHQNVQAYGKGVTGLLFFISNNSRHINENVKRITNRESASPEQSIGSFYSPIKNKRNKDYTNLEIESAFEIIYPTLACDILSYMDIRDFKAT